MAKKQFIVNQTINSMNGNTFAKTAIKDIAKVSINVLRECRQREPKLKMVIKHLISLLNGTEMIFGAKISME